MSLADRSSWLAPRASHGDGMAATHHESGQFVLLREEWSLAPSPVLAAGLALPRMAAWSAHAASEAPVSLGAQPEMEPQHRLVVVMLRAFAEEMRLGNTAEALAKFESVVEQAEGLDGTVEFAFKALLSMVTILIGTGDFASAKGHYATLLSKLSSVTANDANDAVDSVLEAMSKAAASGAASSATDDLQDVSVRSPAQLHACLQAELHRGQPRPTLPLLTLPTSCCSSLPCRSTPRLLL